MGRFGPGKFGTPPGRAVHVGASNPASLEAILTGALIRGPDYTPPLDDSPWDPAATAAFQASAGKDLSIIHYGQPWYLSGASQRFFDGVADLCRVNGSYPLIDWTPWDLTGPAYFTMTDIVAGVYDAYIEDYATDIAAWGYPIFVRPMWEMNGTWFTGWSPAAVGGPSAADFVAAWQRIHTLCKAIAPKMTFVWCPNVIRDTAGVVQYPLTGLYPGDDYVDWVGIDGYAWGSDSLNLSFTDTFQSTYDAIYGLADASKPLMIGEWGCDDSATVVGGSKAAWITDALDVIEAGVAMPNIRAIVWFNRNTDGQLWRIEDGSGAQAAYAAGIAGGRFKGSDFGAATVGPIPAPTR